MNNKNIFIKNKGLRWVGTACLAFGLLGTVQSCKETINTEDFAIAKDPTITEYLTKQSEYSEIVKIFNRVKLGRKGNASTLSSVLASRGNYTIFAPDNAALSAYIAELPGKYSRVEDLTDEEAELIAYSCVIDNGSETAYESAQFPTNGAFSKTDLYDRALTHIEKIDSSQADFEKHSLINGKHRVVKTDKKLSNGYLHTVNSVIAPSNQMVGGLIQSAPNMRIMGEMLTATTWIDSLNAYNDQEYENEERPLTWRLASVAPFEVAKHRYLGFTAFVETDDVFQKEWGIPAAQYDENTKRVTNTDEILRALEAKAAEIFKTNEDAGNYKSSKNALNRFVAYHFLKGKMNHNQFVQHFNEWNYKYGEMKRPQQSKLSIDIWDYFVTMGEPRGLIKVLHEANTKKLYLNRTCRYDVEKNYEQLEVLHPGVEVLPNNEYNGTTYDNNAKNGYFFPITSILAPDEKTTTALASERIRFDISTILPELMSYGCRTDYKYVYFPKMNNPRSKDGTRGYFENITNESEDTRLLYLHSAAVNDPGWMDYQGDEFMVAGVYDFVLKLPPVPKADTYEIRMGVSHNSLRGMCQIYFGDSKLKLIPVGLPYDMRQGSENNPNIGWIRDVEDKETNAEVDKNMRNQGYMKGPKFFTQVNGTGAASARAHSGSIRRIITTQYMEPNKTYYLRFKSALDKNDSQFFSDYFEFVPRSVYNGVIPEDIW